MRLIERQEPGVCGLISTQLQVPRTGLPSAFPVRKQGGGLEMEKQGHELAPIRDVSGSGGGFA